MPAEVPRIVQLRSEEYEEALTLAREYGLDSDMVYQRQWHSYQVSASTIQDYLVSGHEM
jgi:3-hydroxyisobutyrate dehydrogenase-like beta-hydroxyacid dehydrogenase